MPHNCFLSTMLVQLFRGGRDGICHVYWRLGALLEYFQTREGHKWQSRLWIDTL